MKNPLSMDDGWVDRLCLPWKYLVSCFTHSVTYFLTLLRARELAHLSVRSSLWKPIVCLCKRASSHGRKENRKMWSFDKVPIYSVCTLLTRFETIQTKNPPSSRTYRTILSICLDLPWSCNWTLITEGFFKILSLFGIQQQMNTYITARYKSIISSE